MLVRECGDLLEWEATMEVIRLVSERVNGVTLPSDASSKRAIADTGI